MSILIDITANQMIDLYGESEWMRDFTDEAKVVILDAYEKYQSEMLDDGRTHDEFINWEEFFMDAGEYTEQDLERCKDEIDAHQTKIELDNGNLLCMNFI